MDLNDVRRVAEGLRSQVRQLVFDADATLDLMLVALLSGGHVLLEGVPGTAKTLLAKSFAACLSLTTRRIQFTPDLMPGDILGTNLFDFSTGTFHLRRGPVFTQLLIADELNRTPPKTQAALLQAMQEREVTIDGDTHALGEAFLVVATQNPIEQEGTYPLAEAQLDRFLFKVLVTYPARDAERQMVQLHGHRTHEPPAAVLSPVADLAALRALREVVAGIRLSDELVDYVVGIVRATREHPSLAWGASPRAASMLAAAARAHAALQGRTFVIPDDVKALALPALRHRVVLAPGAEIEGVTSDGVLRRLLDQVQAPR